LQQVKDVHKRHGLPHGPGTDGLPNLTALVSERQHFQILALAEEDDRR
jgi:hypothetical protein